MDTKLLELLVCPVTKGPLDYDRDQQELCRAAPGWPTRSATASRCCWKNEARTLSDEELERLRACLHAADAMASPS